ncbi:MAG: hypothetical protein MUF87_11135 [Anaerolineae bacterium]|jgi:hypothetical protein|nr:hypothetical protein [Anaerolineae bacterium]
MRKLGLCLLALIGFWSAPNFSPIQAQPMLPTIGGCEVFPADNPWNTDISAAPVHPNSANYIANINANGGDFVHPDFGENPDYGIPWTTVTNSQALVPVSFLYEDESDPGPYPIPPNAPVEGGSDRHVLVVNTDTCRLYEMFASEFVGGPQNAWTAGSGAVFDLSSNALRPDGWTSADAAGLPILPGLARCDEAMDGPINHALRFTVSRTQRAYIYPATHFASSYTDPNYPPMGLRFRLKASYNTANLTGQALVIAQALKKYGMILADNGSNWFISGETNPNCWNDDQLNQLKAIPGTAFEVIVSPPPPNEDPGNFLGNAGFEGADGGRTMQWVEQNKSGDRRMCNYINPLQPLTNVIVARTGQCAYRFQGSATEGSGLQQRIRGVTGIPAGSTLTISGYARAENLTNDRARLRIKITYNDQARENVNFTFNGGTYPYTAFSTTFVTPKPILKIFWQLNFTAPNGQLYLDDLSFTSSAAPPRNLIPMP